MPWFRIRPRDPADARWPMPERPEITLKADDADDARRRFEAAYRSAPYGTPAVPVPEGSGSFRGDDEALTVEETDEPPSPKP